MVSGIHSFQLFNRYSLKDYNVPRSCLKLWGFSREQDKQEPKLHGAHLLYSVQRGRQIINIWKAWGSRETKVQWRLRQGNTELDKGAVLDTGKKRSLWTQRQWGVQSLTANTRAKCMRELNVAASGFSDWVDKDCFCSFPPAPHIFKVKPTAGWFPLLVKIEEQCPIAVPVETGWRIQRRNNYTTGQNKWENWLLRHWTWGNEWHWEMGKSDS